MTLGLTLGKFAPLHRGHQLLIETALGEVDRLIVMIYDAPETTTVPLPVRAGWIRALYPGAEVIEAWDGPTQIGSTPEIEAMHERYILATLAGRAVTHFYSSEFYGAHVSRALGAVDRRVDQARGAVPISGTAVRADPFGNRAHIAPEVYRDLIARAVFLGAPSTGKTTLAEHAARRFDTVWIPEYGREYWEQHQVGRRLTPQQLVEIAEGHLLREDEAMADANRMAFIDTDATTTFMFARYYHGRALPRLRQLADRARDRYDVFFLCEDDIPYDATADRSGELQRAVFQKQIRADLLRRRTPFISLRGSLEERLSVVAKVMSGFDRFAPLGDVLRGAGGGT